MEEQKVVEVATPEIDEGTFEEVVGTVKTSPNYIKYGIAGAVVVGLGVLGYKKALKPYLKKRKDEKLNTTEVVDENLEYQYDGEVTDANDLEIEVTETEE